MKNRAWIALGIAALAATALLAFAPRRPAAPAPALAVETGPFEAWTHLTSTLAARRTEAVAPQSAGSATLVDLAEEGRTVRAGEVLARFDTAQLRRDLAQAEGELELAEAECEGLERAVLPLEREQLDAQVEEARLAAAEERAFLEECRALVRDGLMSGPELAAQERKAAALGAKAARLDRARELTVGPLHASRLAKARAQRDAARRRCASARAQIEGAVLRAPCDGTLAHLPLQIGTEYRAARVGDEIFPGQAFLCIPDPREWVAEAYLAEADLSRVRPGAEATFAPVACPDLVLTGAVETVGAMAQARPGFPAPARFFRVVLGVAGNDPRLRAGLTVRVSVLAARRERAVLVPRAAVRFDGATALCRVVRDGTASERRLRLGLANERHFEVLEGLDPGEAVALP